MILQHGSCVVTGGGQGIGRAIVERLLADDNAVVVIELDEDALAWVAEHPIGHQLISVVGDALDEAVAERAADLAEEAGPLKGWVNNAAVFQDASLHSDGARQVLDTIALNLDPAVIGSATAIRRFLAADTGGAIANISSHQAQRAVRGAVPKAAIEGLTRALAVDYGPLGIRVNAVALGSIVTERYEAFLREQEPATVERIEKEMRLLHPVGRVGRPEEVASTVAYLLSEEASFINGAIIPVDGGRSSALGRDPEEV